jgi:hypothetical protein
MRSIVYHGGCPDGLTAAWLLARTGPARAFPHHHGDDPPGLAGTGELWCVDLTFDHDTLLRWSGRFGRIFVLDHHVTGLREHLQRNQPLETTLDQAADPSWRGIAVTIDEARSGCGLAAQAVAALHPAMDIPEFVADIEDRDLWRWARPGSRDVCFALEDAFASDRFADVCARLERAALLSRSALQHAGAELAEAFDRQCARYADAATWHTVAGHPVPLARIEHKQYGSATANLLLQRNPEVPFAGYWHTDEKATHINVGLRSETHRHDVSVIAGRYGGGGHRNAAGLRCSDLDDLAR